jgi:hypothetical protein
VFYSEAIDLALDPEATLEQLLEAFKIVAIEHGYRCCIITYGLRQNESFSFEEAEFLKSLGSIQILISKIKEKNNFS